MDNNWGSHGTTAFSAYKSVPKMEKKRKVTLTFKDGTEVSMYRGYGSVERQCIKHLHKKKRRQYFKREDRFNDEKIPQKTVGKNP